MSDDEPTEDRRRAKPVDQLSFLDLLYAVVVADLGMRVSGADLGRVSPADWSVLAVILAVIVLSWIGFHKNRAAMEKSNGRKPIGEIEFFSGRFIQFLVSVIIVLLYFTMGLKLEFPRPGRPDVPAAPEEWITGVLVCIFFAYIFWDVIDICEAAKKNNVGWRKLACAGALVTLVFLVLFGVNFLIIYFTHPPAGCIVQINIVLLVFLWLYRVAQDKCGNTPKPSKSSPEPPQHCIRMRNIGIVLGYSLGAVVFGFAGGVLAGILNF